MAAKALSEIWGADPAVITAEGGRLGGTGLQAGPAMPAKPRAQATSCPLSSPEPRSGPDFSANFM